MSHSVLNILIILQSIPAQENWNTETAQVKTITTHRKQIGLKQNSYNLHCTSKNVLTPA